MTVTMPPDGIPSIGTIYNEIYYETTYVADKEYTWNYPTPQHAIDSLRFQGVDQTAIISMLRRRKTFAWTKEGWVETAGN